MLLTSTMTRDPRRLRFFAPAFFPYPSADRRVRGWSSPPNAATRQVRLSISRLLHKPCQSQPLHRSQVTWPRMVRCPTRCLRPPHVSAVLPTGRDETHLHPPTPPHPPHRSGSPCRPSSGRGAPACTACRSAGGAARDRSRPCAGTSAREVLAAERRSAPAPARPRLDAGHRLHDRLHLLAEVGVGHAEHRRVGHLGWVMSRFSLSCG